MKISCFVKKKCTNVCTNFKGVDKHLFKIIKDHNVPVKRIMDWTKN